MNKILLKETIKKIVRESINEVLLNEPNQKELNSLYEFLNLFYATDADSFLQYNLNSFIDKFYKLLSDALPFIYFIKCDDLGNSFRYHLDKLEKAKEIQNKYRKALEIKKIIIALYDELDRSEILKLYK